MTNGAVVIVENQLAESDHSHLGRLLTYAAGISAAAGWWLQRFMHPDGKIRFGPCRGRPVAGAG
jgi:hypothetical protein